MKFLNNVDINKNQAISLGLEISSSHPASPVAGQVYFNTSDNLVYVYDGTSWYSLATINDVGLRLYTEENYITDGEPLAQSVNNLDMAIGSNVGSRIYTEQNYVTNGESVTASLDALDTNLNLVQSELMPVSGSNANGSYTKFPDGTMICTKFISITPTTSSLYYSLAENFPETFMFDSASGVMPAINITCYTSLYTVNSTSGYAQIAGRAISGSQYRWGIKLPTAPASGTISVTITMIGRWKA